MSLSKTCYLWGGATFDPKGHNLNKPGRGSLDDATYMISMSGGFRQDFFMFSLYKPI